MTKLRNEKYEFIKKSVIRTLIECDVKTLPINPLEICEKRGYTLIKYTDKYTKEDFDMICEVFPNGFNYYSDGKRIIEYNDTLSTERIRTTIFHEIGHAMNKGSKLGNLLQKCRPMTILALPILLGYI